jgi:hypothetical protein
VTHMQLYCHIRKTRGKLMLETEISSVSYAVGFSFHTQSLSITIWFAPTTFLQATCCLICFIPIVKLSFTNRSWLRFIPFIWSGNMNGWQGMLTSPRHLIPPMVYPEVCVWPIGLKKLRAVVIYAILISSFVSCVRSLSAYKTSILLTLFVPPPWY